jgi:glycosyltransferase involved in cell wall biosynthesis
VDLNRRVLVVNKFLHHVGGVETYIKWLSRNLPHVGIDVAFMGMPAPQDEQIMDLGGPTYHTPGRDFHGSPVVKARSALASVYSVGAARALRRAVEDFRPDAVHLQSTCFQLTSSVVRACTRLGVPTVMTAHEYFLVCSNQRLWNDRQSAPCTLCIGESLPKRAASMVGTRCVKSSLSASLVGALELPVSHRVWSEFGGIVHAPSQYMEGMLSAGTSPVRDRVRYLDLSWGAELPQTEAAPEVPTVTYFGRLSREKGVSVLVDAWPSVKLRIPRARLKIFGTGDQELTMREHAAHLEGVSFHGRFDASDVPLILAGSTVTAHPSEWAENSPYTVRESLQGGVPAVVSAAGGMPEMVSRETGTVVPPSDPQRLADALVAELSRERRRTDGFRSAVRRRATTDQQHLQGLVGFYSEAARRIGSEDAFA